VLQCVAVCCSVLQCVAVCCSVLQCIAVCCSVLQCGGFLAKSGNCKAFFMVPCKKITASAIFEMQCQPRKFEVCYRLLQGASLNA